jgi:hypothetical protein
MALYANGSVGRFLIGEEIAESAISAVFERKMA